MTHALARRARVSEERSLIAWKSVHPAAIHLNTCTPRKRSANAHTFWISSGKSPERAQHHSIYAPPPRRKVLHHLRRRGGPRPPHKKRRIDRHRAATPAQRAVHTWQTPPIPKLTRKKKGGNYDAPSNSLISSETTRFLTPNC